MGQTGTDTANIPPKMQVRVSMTARAAEDARTIAQLPMALNHTSRAWNTSLVHIALDIPMANHTTILEVLSQTGRSDRTVIKEWQARPIK